MALKIYNECVSGKFMNTLREIDNKELLNELGVRIQSDKLPKEEVAKLLEAETWKKAYRLANEDEERNKEIAKWDRISWNF